MKFRVWIGQVNQTHVDVVASDPDDAKEKGYRKWRKHLAHASVEEVAQITDQECNLNPYV